MLFFGSSDIIVIFIFQISRIINVEVQKMSKILLVGLLYLILHATKGQGLTNPCTINAKVLFHSSSLKNGSLIDNDCANLPDNYISFYVNNQNFDAGFYVCLNSFYKNLKIGFSKANPPSFFQANSTYTLANSTTSRPIFDEINLKVMKGKVYDKRVFFAMATIERDVFTGYVSAEDTVMVMKLNYNSINSSNAIVYKLDDDLSTLCKNTKNKKRCALASKFSTEPNFFGMVGSITLNKVHEYYDTIKETEKEVTNIQHSVMRVIYRIKRERACLIKIIIDHTYFNANGMSVSSILQEVTQIFTPVSEVFKSLDFNGDGRPDEFNLVVKDLKIYSDQNMTGYHLANEKLKPLEILKRLGRNGAEPTCLSIAFVARDFYPDKILGMGFVATSNPKGRDGGICAPYEYYPHTGKNRFNTLFVTKRFAKKDVPVATLQLVLLHLIGHSFGSKHDSSYSVHCSPGSVSSKTPSYYTVPQSMSFSTCSLMNMNSFIRNRGWCLSKAYNDLDAQNTPSCGNGLLDPGEECDCGSQEMCHFIDKCCIPHGKSKACTIDKSKGYQCSPSVTTCCNQMCQIAVTDEKMVCKQETECRKTTYCNGSAECPIKKKMKDGRLCAGGIRTCREGVCQSTLCRDYNLLDCDCMFPVEDRCQICCVQNGKCKTVLALGLRPKGDNGEILFKASGSTCYNDEGICDFYGICNMIMNNSSISDYVNGHRRRGDYRGWWKNNWFYLLFFIIFIFLLIVVLIQLMRYLKSITNVTNFKYKVLGKKNFFEPIPQINKSDRLLINASRLSALFPYSTIDELDQILTEMEQNNVATETPAVSSLLDKGHLVKTNF